MSTTAQLRKQPAKSAFKGSAPKNLPAAASAGAPTPAGEIKQPSVRGPEIKQPASGRTPAPPAGEIKQSSGRGPEIKQPASGRTPAPAASTASKQRQSSAAKETKSFLKPDEMPEYWTEAPGTLQAFLLAETRPKTEAAFGALLQAFHATFEHLNRFHRLSIKDTGAGGDCLFSSVWEAYRTIAPANRRHLTTQEGVVWLRKMVTAYSVQEYLRVSRETFKVAKEEDEKQQRIARAEATADDSEETKNQVKLRAFELNTRSAFMRQIEASVRSGLRDLTLTLDATDPLTIQHIGVRETGVADNKFPEVVRMVVTEQTADLDRALLETQAVDPATGAYIHSATIAYLDLVMPYLRGRMGGVQEATGISALNQSREQLLLDPTRDVTLAEYEEWFVRAILQTQFPQLGGGRASGAGFPSVFGEAWTIAALSALLGLNIYVLQVIRNQPELFSRTEFFPKNGLYDPSRPVLYLINTGQSHFQLIQLNFTPFASHLAAAGLTDPSRTYSLFCRSFSPQDMNTSGGLLFEQHEQLAYAIGQETKALASTPTPSSEAKLLAELPPTTVAQLSDAERKVLLTLRQQHEPAFGVQESKRGGKSRSETKSKSTLDNETMISLMDLRIVLDEAAAAATDVKEELGSKIKDTKFLKRADNEVAKFGSVPASLWQQIQETLVANADKLTLKNIWHILSVWSLELQETRPLFTPENQVLWQETVARRAAEESAAERAAGGGSSNDLSFDDD
jgi:hypothetical protein